MWTDAASEAIDNACRQWVYWNIQTLCWLIGCSEASSTGGNGSQATGSHDLGGIAQNPDPDDFDPNEIEGSGRLVIGKVPDLERAGQIRSGERTLLNRLPNRGNPRANWEQNASILRQEMAKNRPIRDASVDPRTGALRDNTGFLRAERELLRNHGWRYDAASRTWRPPR